MIWGKRSSFDSRIDVSLTRALRTRHAADPHRGYPSVDQTSVPTGTSFFVLSLRKISNSRRRLGKGISRLSIGVSIDEPSGRRRTIRLPRKSLFNLGNDAREQNQASAPDQDSVLDNEKATRH